MHGAGGCCGFVAPGVVACSCKRVHIVVPTQHQQDSGALIAQGFGHAGQIARIKGHCHRVARGLVQACRRGVALCNQQYTGCIAIAGQLAQGADIATSATAPTCAHPSETACRVHRPQALRDVSQVPQFARCIAHRHQQPATGGDANTERLHSFAHQVRGGFCGFAGVAGLIPQGKRFNSGPPVICIDAGLLALSARSPFSCSRLATVSGSGLVGAWSALGKTKPFSLARCSKVPMPTPPPALTLCQVDFAALRSKPSADALQS